MSYHQASKHLRITGNLKLGIIEITPYNVKDIKGKSIQDIIVERDEWLNGPPASTKKALPWYTVGVNPLVGTGASMRGAVLVLA